MKIILRIVAPLAVLFVFTSTVVAQSPNYRYLEGGYTRPDSDSDPFDGIEFSGSWSLGNSHFRLGYGQFERAGGDDHRQTMDVMEIAVGFHGLLGESADIVLESVYAGYKVTSEPLEPPDQPSWFPSSTIIYDGNGFGIRAGVSWWIDMESVFGLELDGWVSRFFVKDSLVNWWQHTDVTSGNFQLSTSAIIHLKRIALGLRTELGDPDGNWMGVFVRYKFGN